MSWDIFRDVTCIAFKRNLLPRVPGAGPQGLFQRDAGGDQVPSGCPSRQRQRLVTQVCRDLRAKVFRQLCTGMAER